MFFNANIFDFADPFKLEGFSVIPYDKPKTGKSSARNAKTSQGNDRVMFFTCTNNKVSQHPFTINTCEEFLNSEFGLCLVSIDKKDRRTPAEQFGDIANIAYWLAEVPQKMPLLAMDSQAVADIPTPEELDAAWATLVFDDAGAFSGIEPVLSTSSFQLGNGKVRWFDDIPQYINEYKSCEYRRNAIRSKFSVIGDILNELCFTLDMKDENDAQHPGKAMNFSIRAKYPNNIYGLCMFIEALSYNHLFSVPLVKEYTDTNYSSMPKPLPDWVVSKVSFDKKHDRPNKVPEWGGRSKYIKELIDIVRIWNHYFDEYKLTFNGNECGFEDKGAIMKAGHLLGIKSAVDAYYEGVPLEDILL